MTMLGIPCTFFRPLGPLLRWTCQLALDDGRNMLSVLALWGDSRTSCVYKPFHLVVLVSDGVLSCESSLHSLTVCNFCCIKIWILVWSLLITLMVLMGSVWRELSSGGFIVSKTQTIAFLDSPSADEFGKPIGILHGDREEAAGEFSFYRPF